MDLSDDPRPSIPPDTRIFGGYRPPSVADGTVSENLVHALRHLADEFGPAGVTSTVHELWPALRPPSVDELRRQGAVSFVSMLFARSDVFNLGPLPDPTFTGDPARSAYVHGVLDVYDAMCDLVAPLLEPISEVIPSDRGAS